MLVIYSIYPLPLSFFFTTTPVPVTYAWRDELIRKTRKAISKALGREDPPTRPLSRQSSRGEAHQFDHLDDKAVSKANYTA